MSTSIPVSRVNPSPRNPRTTSICARNRSGESPFATVSRGEWSVSARYSCPSPRAASTIASIGVSPSDHSLWLCRSPRSRGRTVAPPTGFASSRSAANRSGTRPARACWMTAKVESPIPGRRRNPGSRSCSSVSPSIAAAAARNAFDL